MRRERLYLERHGKTMHAPTVRDGDNSKTTRKFSPNSPASSGRSKNLIGLGGPVPFHRLGLPFLGLRTLQKPSVFTVDGRREKAYIRSRSIHLTRSGAGVLAPYFQV